MRVYLKLLSFEYDGNVPYFAHLDFFDKVFGDTKISKVKTNWELWLKMGVVLYSLIDCDHVERGKNSQLFNLNHY